MNCRLALLPLSIAICLAAHAAPPAETDAGRFLQRHLNAFVQNDLDAIVADYAPDAVLVSADQTYRGVDSIRGFFREFMRKFPRGKSTVELDRSAFVGDLIYFTWHAATPVLDVPFATDTLVLKDGKILKQTFGGVLRPVPHRPAH